MLKEFNVSTRERYQLMDITDKVEEIVKESAIKDGLVLVFVPHSTAAILLTENEEGLKEDWLDFLKKLVSGFDFLHNRVEEDKSSSSPSLSLRESSVVDDNADSHILSGLLGQERILPVKGGRLIRGTWQQIFLLELDGPRSRKIIVKMIKD